MSPTSNQPGRQEGEEQRDAGEGHRRGESAPQPSQTLMLVREAGYGDQEAFDRLYQRNLASLRTAAALLIGEHLARVDVEDLLQDTFAYAFRKIQQGGFELDATEGAFRRYLGLVLRHKAVDAARRAMAGKRGGGQEKAMRDLYSSTTIELGLKAKDPTPSQHMAGAELSSAVGRAIASLSEQDRRILHYRMVCGMSYGEIMPYLKMVRNGKPVLDEDGNPLPVTKVGTAKSMFSRARQKLLGMLRAQGLVQEAEGEGE